MKNEVLRMEDISCGGSGRTTLRNFALTLYEGELLGVFSHHASVKNDLTALLTGELSARSGRLYIDREPCPFGETDHQRHRKVRVIRSQSTLIDSLSVSDNIFVIRKGFRARMIDNRLLHVQARQLMVEFDLDIDPKIPAGQLSSAQRCTLEIVKAVALGARIVILQDVSTFLSDFEIRQLLSLVTRLKLKGTGFLMVDSSAAHLGQAPDRVAVIKNGRNHWTFRGEAFDEKVLNACFPKSTELGTAPWAGSALENTPEKPPVLAFKAVTAGRLSGLSFKLRQGEALCLIDPEGQGLEVIRAILSGQQQPESGRIRVEGRLFEARNIWEALDQRIAFVVENPAEAMIFPHFTALENLCYPTSRKTPDFWLNPAYLKSCQGEYAHHFGPDMLKRYPDALSPQDLQRLVYCRWHLYSPGVVVCVKPFNTVDKSLEAISAYFIGLLLEKGIAVLILTASTSEAGLPFRKIRVNAKE